MTSALATLRTARTSRRPAEVARLEAFCNTVDRHTFGHHGGKPPGRRELLATPARLRDWLAAQCCSTTP
jgi:hypothetical protein